MIRLEGVDRGRKIVHFKGKVNISSPLLSIRHRGRMFQHNSLVFLWSKMFPTKYCNAILLIVGEFDEKFIVLPKNQRIGACIGICGLYTSNTLGKKWYRYFRLFFNFSWHLSVFQLPVFCTTNPGHKIKYRLRQQRSVVRVNFVLSCVPMKNDI